MKNLLFNPFSPLYFLTSLKDENKGYTYIFSGLFDITQLTNAKLIQEFYGVELIADDFFPPMRVALNPNEIEFLGKRVFYSLDIYGFLTSTFDTFSSTDEIFKNVKIINNQDSVEPFLVGDKFKDTSDFKQEISILLKSEKVYQKYEISDFTSLNTFRDNISSFWTEARCMNLDCILKFEDKQLKLEMSMIEGIKTPLREILNFGSLIRGKKSVDLIFYDLNERNLSFTKDELLFAGFNEVFYVSNLRELENVLKTSESRWIVFLDSSSMIKIFPSEWDQQDDCVIFKTKSVICHKSLIRPFFGFEEERFNFFVNKKDGNLLKELSLFSPSFFIYKREYLLECFKNLSPFIITNEIPSIRSFLIVSTLFARNIKNLDNFLVIKERDALDRFTGRVNKDLLHLLQLFVKFGILDLDGFLSLKNHLRSFCPEIFLSYTQIDGSNGTTCLKLASNRDPVVSIITVLYGGIDFTKKFIESLITTEQKVNYELIILDNNSPDNTRDVIKNLINHSQLNDRVTLVFASENTNFSGGNNLASVYARGKFILFLNNDVEVTDNFLFYMLENFGDDQVGIVGAKLIHPESGHIQHAGILFLNFGAVHIFKNFPPDHHLVQRKLVVNAVTGACLMIRKEVFFKVGGFNINLINELEDIDLCLKVRKLGLKIIYEPKAVVYHYESKSPGRKNPIRFIRNIEVFNCLWPKVEPDYDIFLR